MYSFDSRIRYSEVDSQGFLKIASLIDYFQDCCSLQSEDGGVGLSYTKEHHIAWLVNFWQIDILRRPRLGEWVRTTTIPYDFKAFMGYRNCVMDVLETPGTVPGPKEETPDVPRTVSRTGTERVAISNSVWSLIDLDKSLPVRVPPEMFRAYPMDPKLPMEYLPRKIRLPGMEETAAVTWADPIPVTLSMIDSNQHVNNGQYVRLALSVLSGMGIQEDHIGRILVEYVRQAHLGDVIIPEIYSSIKTISLCSQTDHKPFAIVQVAER